MNKLFESKKKSMLECLQTWEARSDTKHFFEGISNRYNRAVLASVLENQRLMLGNGPWNPKLADKILEITRKVFYGFMPCDIISMQPMYGPFDKVYHLEYSCKLNKPDFLDENNNEFIETFQTDKYGSLPGGLLDIVVESDDCVARTRKLKSITIDWEFYEKENWVNDLVLQIRREVTNEILTDLRLNAGTVANWEFKNESKRDQFEELWGKICHLSGIIYRKTLRGGSNWIVTGSGLAEILSSAFSCIPSCPNNKEYYESLRDTVYFGTLSNRWRLWCDPSLPKNELLMGYKGDSYMDAGYFYNPYIFLTQTPVILDPVEFRPSHGLLSRYSKKMFKKGANFYAKLIVDNLK